MIFIREASKGKLGAAVRIPFREATRGRFETEVDRGLGAERGRDALQGASEGPGRATGTASIRCTPYSLGRRPPPARVPN